MEVIEELDVNQEVSLGTCGIVKRIQQQGGKQMSKYNKKLDNMETYTYLMSHFKMTCDEAADEMKKRGLFDDDVKIVHEGISNYMALINKQKGK